MIKITLNLGIERHFDPDDPREMRNLLWQLGVDMADEGCTVRGMNLPDLITLLKAVKVQKEDYVEVHFERPPF